MHIDSDDRELEVLLRQLETLVHKEGGFLHPALRVVSRGGNLWVESDAQSGEALVRLSPGCLIPIDEARLLLSGSEIVVETCSEKVSSGQKALLDCMLTIYNQGNKVELHRGYSPWSAFSAVPELLDRLYFARKDAPKISHYRDMARQGDLDRLLLEHYIGSRPLRYRVNPEDPASPAYRVLMPFIDFFNHHTASPGFARDGASLVVNASRPVPGTNECFVSYSRMDAMDTFLNYAFVDSSAAFMRSVPLEISIPGAGIIVIKGLVRMRKNPPPPALADLKILVPPFSKGENGEFVLGGLIIPAPQAVPALYRIFAFVIQRFLAPKVGERQLAGMVDSCIEQVLNANKEYFDGLEDTLQRVKDRIAQVPAFEQLRQLIGMQQQKLRDFREAISLARLHAWKAPADSGWISRSPFY